MKFTLAFIAAATLGAMARSDDKPKRDARDAVEGYLAAALGGKTDDAIALAVEGQGPSRKEQIEKFANAVGVKAIKTVRVVADEKKGTALALSETIKLAKVPPNGEGTGVLVFVLVKSGEKWLVKDIDFRSDEAAKAKLKEFREKNPEAKAIPARAEQ